MYDLRVNKGYHLVAITNVLIKVGWTEIFGEIMIDQTVFSCKCYIPHLEYMTGTEELRVIFYIAECFETVMVITMLPVLVKEISCRI